MSLALVRHQRNSLTASRMSHQFDSSVDREMQEVLRNIAVDKQRFMALDAWIRQIMNLPRSRSRSLVARTINLLVPKKLFYQMPDFVTSLVSEEFDALEAGEQHGRSIINNMQDNIRTVIAVTNKRGEDFEILLADIEKAKKENWNARQIHEYIFRSAGIEVRDNISELLDDRFNILTPEEKETKRKMLLEILEKNALMDKSSVELGVRTCLACVEVLEGLGVQFFGFVRHQKSAAAMRDAAITLIESGTVMVGSEQAIRATYQTSLEAIDHALEVTRACRRRSIVSADMQKLLETGRQDIDKKIKEIIDEDASRLAAILPPVETQEVIEASVV